MEAAAPLFGKLFLVTIVVSVLGAVCAFTLAFFNKKADNKLETVPVGDSDN